MTGRTRAGMPEHPVAADPLGAVVQARSEWLATAVTRLHHLPYVAGAWLVGSLGRLTADAYSDIDLVVAVDPAATPAAVFVDPVAGVELPGVVLFTRPKPRNSPAGGAYLAVCVELAGLPVLVDLYLWPVATAAVPDGAEILDARAGTARSDLDFMALLDQHRTTDTTGADPHAPATTLLLVQLAAKYLARRDRVRLAGIARRLGLGGAVDTSALHTAVRERIDLGRYPALRPAVTAAQRLLTLAGQGTVHDGVGPRRQTRRLGPDADQRLFRAGGEHAGGAGQDIPASAGRPGSPSLPNAIRGAPHGSGGAAGHLPQAGHRWLRPLTGGRNNHVYAWDDPHAEPCCVKLYRVDQRRRAEREWEALKLLAEHQVPGVPRPLRVDLGRSPVIAMTLLSGTPLPDSGDPLSALTGLAEMTARLQQVPLTGLLGDLDRVDDLEHYLRRITDVWPQQLAEQPDDPLTDPMRRLIERWTNSGDPEILARPDRVVFSRGDANLCNWLVADRVGCVDFEFAGRSTPSFDAADHLEHISAAGIGDQLWRPLLPLLGVTDTNYERFKAARRACALRWLAILWRQRDQRAAEFHRQHARVRHLTQPGI